MSRPRTQQPLYRTQSDTLKLQRLIEVLKDRGSDLGDSLESSAADFLTDVKPKAKTSLSSIPHYTGDEDDGSSFEEGANDAEEEDWGSDWEYDTSDTVPKTPPPTPQVDIRKPILIPQIKADSPDDDMKVATPPKPSVPPPPLPEDDKSHLDMAVLRRERRASSLALASGVLAANLQKAFDSNEPSKIPEAPATLQNATEHKRDEIIADASEEVAKEEGVEISEASDKNDAVNTSQTAQRDPVVQKTENMLEATGLLGRRMSSSGSSSSEPAKKNSLEALVKQSTSVLNTILAVVKDEANSSDYKCEKNEHKPIQEEPGEMTVKTTSNPGPVAKEPEPESKSEPEQVEESPAPVPTPIVIEPPTVREEPPTPSSVKKGVRFEEQENPDEQPVQPTITDLRDQPSDKSQYDEVPEPMPELPILVSNENLLKPIPMAPRKISLPAPTIPESPAPRIQAPRPRSNRKKSTLASQWRKNRVKQRSRECTPIMSETNSDRGDEEEDDNEDSNAPVVPDKAAFSSRIDTFREWQRTYPHTTPTPECLCSAGFFMIPGSEDSVRCFQCGLVQFGWEPGDSPWKRHRRYSPNCLYVITKTKEGDTLD